jgi:hypothetical protein
MTAPQHPYPADASPSTGAGAPRALRWAIWVALFALIAAAIVCVIWVLVGPENGIVGRAFLTILLLAAFAGVAILDTHLAQRRPAWFALTSMVTWVVTMLLGAFLIWMPADGSAYFDGVGRFLSFLLIVLVLQLALLHLRLYTKALERHVNGFTRTVGITTIALVAILALMLVIPLTFHEFIDFRDFYWRIVMAVTILAAVGTALVPLVNALFAPKRPRPAAYPAVGAYPQQAPGYPQGQPAAHTGAPAPQPWPTFADGVTPLPVMPDGSPDWNAYYTGYPSVPQQSAPGQQPGQPASPSGYQGFPPPPPLPPQ